MDERLRLIFSLLLSLTLAACGDDPQTEDGVPALIAVAERGDIDSLNALLRRDIIPNPAVNPRSREERRRTRAIV